MPRLRERDLRAGPAQATLEPGSGNTAATASATFASPTQPRGVHDQFGSPLEWPDGPVDLGFALAKQQNEGRDAGAIDELLRELAELRELDQKRNAQAPGSAAHDAATLAVDLKSNRLFDRFRDLKQRRFRRRMATDLDDTHRVDARLLAHRLGGARLN